MRGQSAERSWPLVLVATVAVIVVQAPAAHAQDPLDEVVDQAGDAVSGVTDGLGEPDPVDEAIDTLGDATGVDTKPIKQVKGTVDSTVDRVLDEAPDTGGETQPGARVSEPGGTGSPGSHWGAKPQAGGPAESRSTARVPVRRSVPRKPGLEPEFTGAPLNATSPAAVPSERRSIAGPRAPSVSTIIRKLAFPLILGLAVVMFLGIQSRIDGSDTKLLQAPQDTHYLSFQ